MTAHELTELATRIERLRQEVAAVEHDSPKGALSGALFRTGTELQSALNALDPLIGRAARAEAHENARNVDRSAA